MAAEPEKPDLKVFRDPKTGHLSYKLPRKGARWTGRLASLDEVQKAIVKELPPPFTITYIGEDEKDA